MNFLYILDWERVIESVSTIRNFVITGDGVLVWVFVIYRRLGMGGRISLNNHNSVITGGSILGW